MQKGVNYSTALKELINTSHSSGTPNDEWYEYIAKKIFHNNNDNLGAFQKELKQIISSGYKFNVTMINRLMDYCTINFDVNLHQLILTQILNKLPPNELDGISESVLKKFTAKRMANINGQRIGLSRRNTTNKLV